MQKYYIMIDEFQTISTHLTQTLVVHSTCQSSGERTALRVRVINKVDHAGVLFLNPFV